MTILDKNIWHEYDKNSEYGFLILKSIQKENPDIIPNDEMLVGKIVFLLNYIQRMTEYERIYAYRLLNIDNLFICEIEKRVGK